MKKFNWLLLAVLLTIVAIVPNTAAAFADQPVAFVVFDNSGCLLYTSNNKSNFYKYRSNL